MIYGQNGPKIEEFLEDGSFIRCLVGGRGCLSEETPIYDPMNGESVAIAERANRAESFHVHSLTPQGHRICKAQRPFCKGVDRLWRVTLETGAEFRCASEHKILTPRGWLPISRLPLGHSVASSGIPPQTILDSARVAFIIRWTRIIKIEQEESTSAYYDFTVPESGNYWACGAWHHNSGKTRALIEDITRHLWRNAGGKAIVARHTEASQEDSSIDSAWQFFESLGPGYSPALGLFKAWNNGRTFRVPSELAVLTMKEECAHMTSRAEIANWIIRRGDDLCGYIEFRGLPDADKGKFRGMECSYLALVEADQISKKQFELSLACLRWKGSDPETCDRKGFIKDRCVVLDTNPPSPSHWIAEMEKEQANKSSHERIMRFWHIPTQENEHNLPENYIRDTILLPYAQNPPMLERMLYGRYADAFDGKPVYYAYRRNAHEAERLGWPRGASLIVGQDVGTNNASCISAFKQHNGHLHWWCMREIILTGSDTDRQCIELLKVLANEFPFWNLGGDVCPQALFFCDPAARNSAFTARGPTSSALKVMQSHGIFPGMKIAAHLQPTIAAVNRLLQGCHTEVVGGEKRTVWHFKIDVNRCPTLARAFRGAYRYPTKTEPGYGSDLPLKGSLTDHVDHPADALRYSIINALDIAEEHYPAGMTSPRQSTFNPEPSRTI